MERAKSEADGRAWKTLVSPAAQVSADRRKRATSYQKQRTGLARLNVLALQD
jgi:hypothetical protein